MRPSSTSSVIVGGVQAAELKNPSEYVGLDADDDSDGSREANEFFDKINVTTTLKLRISNVIDSMYYCMILVSFNTFL